MTADWVERTIGDVAEIIGGGTPPTRDPSNFNGDIPWLTPKDLSGIHPRYVTGGERSLSMKGLRASSARLLPPGSVLLTTRAPIGYVAIAASSVSTNQGFRSLIPKSEIDHGFLYYWLKGNIPKLERHASGSTFKELSGSSLSRIRILFPRSIYEQQAIASVLGALDDKIELNRRMSDTLDQMAETIFHEWFTSAASLQEQRKGEQPKRLRDVLKLQYGKGLRKADRIAGPIPVYGSGGAFDYHNEPLIEGPDIIVGRKGTVGSLYWVDEPSFPGDTVFYVESSLPLTYCYYLLRTLGLNEMNTDAAVPGLNRENVYHLEVPSPPARFIEQFDSVAAPMRERIRVANVESRTLAELRDTLLPKLISGELRLPEAEQLVSEVA